MTNKQTKADRLSQLDRAVDAEEALRKQLADASDDFDRREAAAGRVHHLFAGHLWMWAFGLGAVGTMVWVIPIAPWQAVAGPLLVAASVVLFLVYLTALFRHRRFRASLPFPVTGFEETVGLDEFVTVPRLRIDFSGPLPEQEALQRALSSGRYLAEIVSVEGQDVAVVGGPFGAEETNKTPARWLIQLLKALAPVHAHHPIAAVRIDSYRQTEFYRPPSD